MRSISHPRAALPGRCSFDRLQRPLQIVHQRQEILHAFGASALHQLHLLPQRALAEIIELGLQTQVFVLPFRNLRREIVLRDLVLGRLSLYSIPCHCVSIRRAFICHIGTRFPVAGGVPIPAGSPRLRQSPHYKPFPCPYPMYYLIFHSPFSSKIYTNRTKHQPRMKIAGRLSISGSRAERHSRTVSVRIYSCGER